MSRLQKKCFIASTTMHLSLVLLLFLSPAFFLSEDKNKKTEQIQVLNFIPSKLIDEPFASAGSSKPAGDPAPAQPEAPPPQPALRSEPLPEPPAPVRVEPKPAPPTPKKEPDLPIKPAREATQTPPKPTPNETAPKEKPKKHEIVPSYTKAPSNSQQASKARAQAEAEAKAAKEARARYSESISKLSEALNRSGSSGSGVELPNIGAGEAYANWHWVVVKRFDDAWIPGPNIESTATVKASVTILRNGKVSAFKILQKSGNAPLDESVRHALQRVRDVDPFPEGAKDHDRTLILNFNLKSKRFSG